MRFLPRLPERADFIIGALFFLLMVIFWPGIAGAGTAPRWALLSVTVPVLLFWRQTRIWNIPATAFLVFATLSLIWTPQAYEGMDALWKLYLLAGLFLLGTSLDDLRPAYIGAALGIALNSALAVAQTFGWDGIPQTIPPAGLFVNKNLLAETAVLALIGVAFIPDRCRIYLALAVAPSVFLPLSRGALAALAVAAAVWLWPRYRLVAAMILLAGIVAIAASMAGTTLYSTGERLNIWRDTLSGLTWLGHGVGSFYQTFPNFAVHNDILAVRTDHAHNDLLELVFEYGIGAVPAIAITAYCLSGTGIAERLILIAFIVEGCFGFPLHVPATAGFAAIVAGNLCAHRHPVRRHVARRPMAFRAGVEPLEIPAGRAAAFRDG